MPSRYFLKLPHISSKNYFWGFPSPVMTLESYYFFSVLQIFFYGPMMTFFPIAHLWAGGSLARNDRPRQLKPNFPYSRHCPLLCQQRVLADLGLEGSQTSGHLARPPAQSSSSRAGTQQMLVSPLTCESTGQNLSWGEKSLI